MIFQVNFVLKMVRNLMIQIFFLTLILCYCIFNVTFAALPPNEITSITSSSNIIFTKNDIISAILYHRSVIKTIATACVYTDNVGGDFDLIASAPVHYYDHDNFKMYNSFLGEVDYTLQVKSTNASTPINLLPNIAMPLTNHANVRGGPCNNRLIILAKFNSLAVRHAKHGSYSIAFSLSASNYTG